MVDFSQDSISPGYLVSYQYDYRIAYDDGQLTYMPGRIGLSNLLYWTRQQPTPPKGQVVSMTLTNKAGEILQKDLSFSTGVDGILWLPVLVPNEKFFAVQNCRLAQQLMATSEKTLNVGGDGAGLFTMEYGTYNPPPKQE